MCVWTVPEQYSKLIRNGDKIFFWKAGGKEGNAGIYAFGEAVSEVKDIETPPQCKPFIISRDYLASTPLRVRVKYERKFQDRPILRDELKNHPKLKKLMVITFRAGTVFPVRDDEVADLCKMVGV